MQLIKSIFRSLKHSTNPAIGIDIPMEKVLQIKEVLTENQVVWEPWEEAQLRELGFWRWVAYEGYAGKKPRDFPSHQRKFMLESFAKTGWSVTDFSTSSILELGCGPLGMIEFLESPKKVGIDPLNNYYSMLFLKLRKNNVRYLTDLELLEKDFSAGLVICFNVIDHTDNPQYFLSELFQRLEKDGRFLIEVNCHEPGFEGTEEHAKMHPSPLTSQQVMELVREFGIIEGHEISDIPTEDSEFPVLVWGKKK